MSAGGIISLTEPGSHQSLTTETYLVAFLHLIRSEHQGIIAAEEELLH